MELHIAMLTRHEYKTAYLHCAFICTKFSGPTTYGSLQAGKVGRETRAVAFGRCMKKARMTRTGEAGRTKTGGQQRITPSRQAPAEAERR